MSKVGWVRHLVDQKHWGYIKLSQLWMKEDLQTQSTQVHQVLFSQLPPYLSKPYGSTRNPPDLSVSICHWLFSILNNLGLDHFYKTILTISTIQSIKGFRKSSNLNIFVKPWNFKRGKFSLKLETIYMYLGKLPKTPTLDTNIGQIDLCQMHICTPNEISIVLWEGKEDGSEKLWKLGKTMFLSSG